MPAVSIILPLYNGEKFIEKTLLAIGEQTFSDAELIVIDDGSTDDSANIVKAVSSAASAPLLKNLRLITKENGGVAAARNIGIKNASAKWLAFLDQDDIWLPAKLEKQLAAVDRANAKWSYTAFVRTYANGKKIVKQNGSADQTETLKKLLVGKLFIPPSTVLAEKEICEKEGGFNSEFIPSDEWDLFLTFAEKYQPAYCREILVRFLSHPSSTAKKQKLKIFNAQLNVIHKHKKIAAKKNMTAELRKREANVLWHIGKEHLSSGNKKSARDFFKKAVKKNPTRLKFLFSLLNSF